MYATLSSRDRRCHVRERVLDADASGDVLRDALQRQVIDVPALGEVDRLDEAEAPPELPGQGLAAGDREQVEHRSRLRDGHGARRRGRVVEGRLAPFTDEKVGAQRESLRREIEADPAERVRVGVGIGVARVEDAIEKIREALHRARRAGREDEAGRDREHRGGLWTQRARRWIARRGRHVVRDADRARELRLQRRTCTSATRPTHQCGQEGGRRKEERQRPRTAEHGR